MLHAVIMAGGSGTRFWPKSRRDHPKQLLRLHGDATMLQQTVARIAPLVPPDRILVITGIDQAEAVRSQLEGVPPENVIAEPCPRDTAACVGLAALVIARRDPDGTMLVMPADHVIRPDDVFGRTVQGAVGLIDDDPTVFVTFGVRPTYPETGYGYIERGKCIGQREGATFHEVVRFREKPAIEKAVEFLATGRFFWNAGIFLWRARAVLDALAVHQPEMTAGLDRIGQALGTPAERDVLDAVFPTLPKKPIDKAVMEQASNVRVFEVVYDWSDVGDWRALTTLVPPDTSGNSTQGRVLAVDTRDSIIVSDDGGLIATIGIDNLVIVQSRGATLIARKADLDKLKNLVEGLESAGHGEYA